MSLPLLYQQPETDQDWRDWAFNHAANHYDMITAGNTKQYQSGNANTNAATSSGNVLSFSSVPSFVVQGMGVADSTTADAIPSGTTVLGASATAVDLSASVAHTVGSGDTIAFTPGNNIKPLDQYPLNPMDRNNLGMWLYQHQTMHNQINAVLGTSGFNLLDLDWQDPDQFAEWLMLNATEHQTICAALGIG